MSRVIQEVKCFLCGQVAGYVVEGKFFTGGPAPQPATWRPGLRCVRCGGSLYVEITETTVPVPEVAGLVPGELVISRQLLGESDGSELIRDQQERKSKSCIGCGAPVVKALRCRRCYVRHRYATDPVYRARQLAMQENWRRRRQSMRAMANSSASR